MACPYCTKRECRKGRPLCRRPDRKQRAHTCYCPGYHYPHRCGSGLCLENPNSQDRMNAILYGTESQVA